MGINLLKQVKGNPIDIEKLKEIYGEYTSCDLDTITFNIIEIDPNNIPESKGVQKDISMPYYNFNVSVNSFHDILEEIDKKEGITYTKEQEDKFILNKKEVKNLSLKSNDWRYRMVDIDSFLFETEPPNIETVQLEILNGIRDPVFGKKSFIDAVLSSY